MKKHLILFSFLLFSISLINCSKREPFFSSDPENFLDESSILKGKVSGTLTVEHSPYRVNGVIEIDSLSTLTIEPGVSIFFSNSSILVVRGRLLAQGSSNAPAIFTADNGSTHWEGIQFVNSRHNSLISFSIIEKASLSEYNNLGAVTFDNSSFAIHNSIIKNNSSHQGGGIYLKNSQGEIKNCIFTYNQADIFGGAVLAYNSDLAFINNTVYKNSTQNYGGGLVLMEAASSQVENNIFYQNSGRIGVPGIAVKGDTSKNVIKYNYEAYGINSPFFISETDLHLSHNSPCINNGDPSKEFNDADNSRNDQGAYGGPLGNW